MALLDRMLRPLFHAWNAFQERDRERIDPSVIGPNYGSQPHRTRLRASNEKSIISSVLTRMSMDVAGIDVRHCRVDLDGRYIEDISSGLQNCLTLEANMDQAARAFRQDIVQTLFDRGVAAIVPVDTSVNPATGSFDIKTLRVGEITGWYPRHVRVSVYNDEKGIRQEVTLEKRFVAIVENPLYAVMNEPNGVLQRLIRKLNLLDQVDEATSSGKLDLLIQLPYVVKSEARRKQAADRAKDIEFQLKTNQYGIAYIDGTEKITQLNRPAENKLLDQIDYLVKLLYGQLGLTPEVMNGSANEEAMVNYYARTIEPIVAAVVEAMRRSFLTKTGRSQGQWILAFRDPFKLVPVKDLAEIADKFVRNTVLTPNDMRQAMGLKPNRDPKADMLKNPNMPDPPPAPTSEPINPSTQTGGDLQNGSQNGGL